MTDQSPVELQERVIPEISTKFKSILLFGPQGAGKGTVGKILAQAGSHVHLSTGDIFRGLAPDSPAGKVVQKYVSQGLLVPDDVTVEIWHYYVSGLIATNQYQPEQQFLLLDGIPRTTNQAKVLDQYVDIQQVIVLDVDDRDELITRLQRRAKIEGRVDDANRELLERRLEIYYSETEKLIQHYPADRISTFNAAQPPLRVLGDILDKLAETLTCSKSPLPNK